MASKTQRPVTTEVEAISENVSGYVGDIISPAWNSVLCETHERNGKVITRVHPFAKFLLARVVFMYTKTIEYNEQGAIVGHKRKFNGDYWLPNWNELAEEFGCSTRTLKDDLALLKKKGLVITKPMRDRLPSDGVKNIREFVIPVASKIAEITPRHGAAKPAPEKRVGKGVKEGEVGNGEVSSPAPSEVSSPAPSEVSSPAQAKVEEEKVKPTKAERDDMFDLIADVWSMDKDMQASMIGKYVTACLRKDPRPTRKDLQYVRDWMTAFVFECRDAFKAHMVGTYWQQAMDDRAAYPDDTIEQLTAIKRAQSAQRKVTNGNANNGRSNNRNGKQVRYTEQERQRLLASA